MLQWFFVWTVAMMLVGAIGLLHAAPAGMQRLKQQGKLVVAIDATYPPMESEGPDGKPVGFDIDFARELARRLGVQAEFVVMHWEGILAGLQSGRYDVIISSMNITDERKHMVDFVEYVKMSQLFISKKGIHVTTDKDLAGRIVAVQADTTSFEFVEGLQKKGLPVREIKAFKLATEAFAAVKAGQADVIVVDEPVGKYYARQDANTFQITGRAMAPEPVGVAMKKADGDLRQAIEQAVEAMRQDGTLKKISDTWFGGELGT